MESKKDNLDFDSSEPTHNSSAWVLSYCDLLCQLICFFVLLFATSSVKNQQWEEVKTSLSQRLAPNKDATINNPAAEISIEKIVVGQGRDIGYLNQVLKEKIGDSALKDKLLIQNMKDRLVLSITGDQSFVSGSIQMTPELQSLLVLLSGVLGTMNNRIEIHGNADSSPTSGKEFPSNWELSLARSQAVADMLREHGYNFPLRVYGRGDSTYADLPQSLNLKEKQKLSRRIDIIIRSEGVH